VRAGSCLAALVALSAVGCGSAAERNAAPPTTRSGVKITASSPGTAPTHPSTPSSAPPSIGSSASPTSTVITHQAALRCAGAVAARMPVNERAGQLLMVAVPVKDPSSGARLVRADKLGGVFLAGRTVTTPQAVAGQLDVLQRASRKASGVPLLVAVDQEGGRIQALRGAGFGSVPTALQQGRLDDAVLRARARTWAAGLSRAGVNLDLAPVADTVPAGFARRNPPIGVLDRQFGSDPKLVAGHVAAFVTGAHEGGVLTTVKHFPGLGRVSRNTDYSPSAIDATTTSRDPYLQPFADGIEAGAGVVMVSSATYTRIDPQRPAVFSAVVVDGLLRGDLGYQGVVMTDDVGAAAAVRAVAPGQRAVRFVRAGGDLVLTVQPKDAAPMRAALVSEASRSRAFARRLEQSTMRIIALKIEAGLAPCTP